MISRHDSRAIDQLRPFSFQPGIAPHATGSVLAACGQTRVICAVTVAEKGLREIFVLQQAALA